MVKRKSEYQILQKEHICGGDGMLTAEFLLSPAELYDKGRVFSKMTLEPGSSIGYHIHEGEMESYFIISGKAEFGDNGETVTLLPGDTTLTLSGEGHSIRSIGETALEFIALILHK